VLDEVEPLALQETDLPLTARLRMAGRYGQDVEGLRDCCNPQEHSLIGSTPFLWSELRWAARSEAVVHLDDLLLRRVRLGLTLPQGGLEYLDRIQPIVQSELGWGNARWEQEAAAYQALWKSAYATSH
jgi:glycerol-3-phosphate dehydrogenase